MLTLIQGGAEWTPALLADELGTSERNIYRDIKLLKHSGVPVSFDRDAGGYVVGRPFFLPPVDLTAEEACALVLLTERIHEADVLPNPRPAEAAMRKLRATLPEALREALAELVPRVTLDLARTETSSAEDVWSQLSWAIARRRTVEVSYEPVSRGDASPIAHEEFCFDPYELYFGQRAWYVLGHHHLRGQTRTLRLSRFCNLHITEDTFTIADEFSLAAHFGQAWRMIPGDRQRHRIQLRFTADVAETVAETLWHRTQTNEHHDDGGVTLHFEIDGLDEIVWWILGYGPHCTVEHPRELRDRVAELVKATAQLYEHH